MSQFIDAVGPLVVICLFVLAAYLVYRLILHAAAKTREVWLELERKSIENQAARANTRLVTVTQQAAPVARQHVESGALYESMFELLRADVDSRKLPQPVPQSLHWAPHVIDRRPVAQLPEPEEDVLDKPRIEPLSVMECFARGLFDDPARLLTGFEDGNAFYSPVDRTYGVCVAGLPGMGKSNGMRFYALQMVLHGAQMAIIDPAANSASGEGLAASFEHHLWAPMAVELDEIVGLLRQIDLLGQRRDSGRDADLTPLLLLADEVTSLITDDEYGAEIKALLIRINRRYRKNKIYTIGAGQDWLAGAQRGDTSLRNAYVCKTVFRIDRTNAAKLLPNPKFVPLAPELREGQAIFVGHDAVGHVIDVPYCPASVVGQILGQNAQPRRSQVVEPRTAPRTVPRIEAHEGDDSEPSVYVEGDAAVNVVDASLSIDAHKLRMVRNLYRLGYKRNEILRELWQVDTKKGGNKVIAAARELDEIIAYIMRSNENGR